MGSSTDVVLVVLIVLLILYVYFQAEIKSAWYRAYPEPRPGPDIAGCGYESLDRGWYDPDNRGVNNRYCRFVGNSPYIQFSCLDNKGKETPMSFDFSKTPHEAFDATKNKCLW
jgi:hypothetical protein